MAIVFRRLKWLSPYTICRVLPQVLDQAVMSKPVKKIAPFERWVAYTGPLMDAMFWVVL